MYTSILTVGKHLIAAPRFPEFAKKIYADIERKMLSNTPQRLMGKTRAVPVLVSRRGKARGDLRGNKTKRRYRRKNKTLQPKIIVFVTINH